MGKPARESVSLVPVVEEGWRDWLIATVQVALVCLLIAIVVTFINGFLFWGNLWSSLGFGLSIMVAHNLLLKLSPHSPPWLNIALALLIGVVAGMANLYLVLWVLVPEVLAQMALESWLLNLSGSALISAIAFYYFVSRYRLQVLRAEVSEQQRLRAEREQALALSQLKVMQSQMEPHFLFNTLANVQALIDADPPRARRMIEALTTMLRANLQRVRAETTTLGDELVIVESYLQIQAIRMGERLHYELQVPDCLRSLPLPPLVLQPLVENAIQHGLEPKADGGSLVVRAGLENTSDGESVCQLQVTDTGLGLAASGQTQGEGVGLANLRQRLAALYGEQASLSMRPGAEDGMEVKVTLPLNAANEPIRSSGADHE